MKHLLLIQTGGLRETLETLAAATDAATARHGLRIDWVVDEACAHLVSWHFASQQVFALPIESLRTGSLASLRDERLRFLKKQLRGHEYDVIVDARGSADTALINRLARGRARWGFDVHSAKTPFAALLYANDVRGGEHGERDVRRLLAGALDYRYSPAAASYGISNQLLASNDVIDQEYVLFDHGSPDANKQWGETFWITLSKAAVDEGFRVCLLWTNAAARLRAIQIAESCRNAEVIPKPSISALAPLIQRAHALVTVDADEALLGRALEVTTRDLSAIGGGGGNESVAFNLWDEVSHAIANSY